MSDNEFEEMYQKGDMVWVDPDGREWVPAHIHAALKRENGRLRGFLDTIMLNWEKHRVYKALLTAEEQE